MQGNRKGITPVVSVILLLLITISIVGFSLIFFQRTAQGAGEEAQTQLQQQLASASERFEIVNIDKNKVYVKNTGTANLQNLRFYVDGSEISATSIPIAPNTVGEATLDSAKLAQVPGDKLKVTSLGSQDSVDAKFYAKQTVAYWRFDESDGRTVKDYSGNGNDGTFVGENWNDGTLKPSCPNCPIQTTGKFGNALQFDGSDDYVNAGNDASLRPTTFSVETWVKMKSTTGAIIEGKMSANTYGWYLEWAYGNTLRFALHKGVPVGTDFNLKTDAVTDTWYHLAFTYDSNSDVVKGYVNGVKTVDSTYADYAPDTAKNFIIGANPDSLVQNFNGTIDEVRIYNRALKPEEIIEDMNSAYPISRTVASYSFEKIEPKALDTHNIVKGRYGAAVSFDGVDDYVKIPASATIFDFTASPFSIEFWVYPRALTDPVVLVNRGADQADGYIIQTTTDGSINFRTSQASASQVSNTGAGALPLNTWKHVVVTREAGAATIYINSVDLTTTRATHLDPLTANRPLVFGIHTDEANYRFNGTIDEVRILNVAR